MAAAGVSPAVGGLNVIALVSGGKDSFFSALHCLENGHRLVALANLHPPPPPRATPRSRGAAEAGAGSGSGSSSAEVADEKDEGGGEEEEEEETDLNSFMYQTVGHQVIPLYADATGIPLYRRPILGGAVQDARDYSTAAAAPAAAEDAEGADETESMIPLLREVMQKHPEANALSAGAILSTYQRTRVESVALRLGLTPLAYLWKYPVLPGPSADVPGGQDEAQLLVDMAAAGLEARIIKVASGGLDESFLGENVASAKGVMRLKTAMGRFGASTESGAVIGEGGEFETLVVDGPARLFKKRVVIGEDDRVIVREGGGTAWVRIQTAKLEEKSIEDGHEKDLVVRRPDLLDGRFAAVLEKTQSTDSKNEAEGTEDSLSNDEQTPLPALTSPSLYTWAVTRPTQSVPTDITIEDETELLVQEIRNRLNQHNLSPTSITSTVIGLRRMSDFPAINKIYGSLFPEPNPPSRVTISCGDLLPQDANIVIYLTVHPGKTDRQGLHVQGRSYWAPANIGPYSQAITFPTHGLSKIGEVSSNGSRAVQIAGQIPLVPASMELPTEGGFEMQLALSLQHLWRIGVEMGVQWWTSAAVYFPRNSGEQKRTQYTIPARQKALLAWRAWKVAHQFKPSSDNEEDENGPDLWDRKFNPAYMTFGGGDAEKAPGLPDYSVLQLEDDDDEDEQQESKRPVPFLFAAEVDELPRSAEAEWHAHAGLSRVGLSSSDSSEAIVTHGQAYKSALGTCRIYHCALKSDADTLLHSAAAVEVEDASVSHVAAALGETVKETSELLGRSLCQDGPSQKGTAPVPYLLYVDTGIFSQEQVSGAMRDQGLAVIPCASIYGGHRGARLAVVALYRNVSSAE